MGCHGAIFRKKCLDVITVDWFYCCLIKYSFITAGGWILSSWPGCFFCRILTMYGVAIRGADISGTSVKGEIGATFRPGEKSSFPQA